MAKRVKTKKGSIGKKALAAILAASMVLSSSAFSVLAADVPMPIIELKPADIVVEINGIQAESGTAVSAENSKIEYNGTAQTPEITVYDNTDKDVKKIINKAAYDLEWSNNTNATTAGKEATVKIKFKQNPGNAYEGTDDVERTFEIGKLEMSSSNTKVKLQSNSGFVYTGGKQTPTIASVEVTNKKGESVVLPVADYELAADQGSDLTSAKTQHIKLAITKTAQNNIDLSGDITLEDYSISKASFDENNVTITSKPVAFANGNKVPVDITVTNKAGEKELTGWKVKYFDGNNQPVGEEPSRGDETYAQSDMGTYKIQIISDGKGNYEEGGIIESSYTIKGRSLQMAVDKYLKGKTANIFGSLNSDENGLLYFTYNGAEQEVKASDVTSALEGISTANYTVDCSKAKGTNVGNDYVITLTGKNDYAGDKTEIPFEIRPRQINAANFDEDSDGTWFSAEVGKKHNGELSTNAIVKIIDEQLETNEDYVLEVNKDYTFTTNILSKTKAEVSITGIGNYTTENEDGTSKVLTVEANVKNQLNLNDVSIDAEIATVYPYTGEWITPEKSKVKVVEDKGKSTEYTLKVGTDFDVEYPSTPEGQNIYAGKGYVTIKGKEAAGYTGNRKVEFAIEGKNVADYFEIAPIESREVKSTDAAIPFNKLKVIYKDSKNEAARNVILDSSSLKYYVDNVERDPVEDIPNIEESCVVTIKVSAKGEYSGVLEASYILLGKDIAENVTIADIDEQTYNGEEIKPALVVTNPTAGDPNDRVLVAGKDYDAVYEHNVDAGTAVITLRLKGKYSGTVIKTFEIKKAPGYVKLDSTQEATLAAGVGVGDADVTPQLEAYLTAGDKKVNDTTLKVGEMKSSDESVVTIVDGKIHFAGEGDAVVTITPSSSNIAAAAIEVPVKVTAAPAEKLVANCTPSRLKKVKNSFTVTTSTVKDADKWVIRYSLKNLNKTTKGSVKATFSDVNKVKQQVVKVNKSGAKYYVQCRVVKDGVKSAWSKVKTVKSR